MVKLKSKVSKDYFGSKNGERKASQTSCNEIRNALVPTRNSCILIACMSKSMRNHSATHLCKQECPRENTFRGATFIVGQGK